VLELLHRIFQQQAILTRLVAKCGLRPVRLRCLFAVDSYLGWSREILKLVRGNGNCLGVFDGLVAGGCEILAVWLFTRAKFHLSKVEALIRDVGVRVFYILLGRLRAIGGGRGEGLFPLVLQGKQVLLQWEYSQFASLWWVWRRRPVDGSENRSRHGCCQGSDQVALVIFFQVSYV